MNIFVLHKDPIIAAQMACDKHVVKMILETAQMLCTAATAAGHTTPYKATHKGHPCTLWAGHSAGNWKWLIQYGIALCAEYTKRYGRRHKSETIIRHCGELNLEFENSKQTPFAQAMPEQYRNDCAVTAYRAYYMGDKASFATWKTQAPDWWRI